MGRGSGRLGGMPNIAAGMRARASFPVVRNVSSVRSRFEERRGRRRRVHRANPVRYASSRVSSHRVGSQIRGFTFYSDVSGPQVLDANLRQKKFDFHYIARWHNLDIYTY